MCKTNLDESTTINTGLHTTQTSISNEIQTSITSAETTIISTVNIRTTSPSSTHHDPTSLPLISSTSSHFRSTSCAPDMTKTPCDMLQPCQNDGTCNNANTTRNSYICLCQTGFHGAQCQNDGRPCKPDTCWNNGKRNNAHSQLGNICSSDCRRLL